jgi:N,N'-diacetyllegionaminate synthase
MKKIYIISELCGQWGGSVRKAEQMILQSKMFGADAVKVQLWDTYRMPGDNREKWEYLTMNRQQFRQLEKFAKDLNIDFFASPFHEDRLVWTYGLKINKIASSLLEWDFDLCKKITDTNDIVYCSLGKWDKKEFPFDKDNVKYFHCVAKYPHTFSEAKTLMPKSFDNKLVGYSDHTIGIKACKLAIDRGATIIEKHFTLNHKLQCDTESAHICSMDYKELEELRNYCDTRHK